MTNVLERELSRFDAPDSEDTITSRFERQVTAFPDKPAIVTDEATLTYLGLNREANRIAAGLLSFRSQPGRPIVLFMRHDAARIAAMLGVLKANRIFIPLAPDSPEKWLTQVFEDSGAAEIIVDGSTRSIAEAAANGNITVMDVEKLARSSETFVAHRTVSPDDTAYVVYTSGSTGRPKGVANSHRSLIRRGDVRSSFFKLVPDGRHGNLRSSGVCTGINETFLPLLSGACLFPFDLHRRGLQELAPWLIAQKITYVSFSGSLLRAWLASLPKDVRFPALSFVRATGERLYAQDVIRMSRHLEGDWRIGHSYSSGEAGTIAAQVFTASRLPEPGIVAVGRPVDGVEVFLQDEKGAPVAPGEIGEVVVRSRFFARGYWNNPGLTAQVFQTDPLDNDIRIYRTGDLGRWRSDGTLEHAGRKGRTIRLRGYNVEPFQVECELMRQSDIADAVVVLYDGAAGDEPSLVGYVVAPANTSPSAIRAGLAERLPSYMVPSHIIVLDSFPIGASGKIDLNALPPPRREDLHLVPFRTPTDEHERELCTIWQDVLNLPKIGIDDDFFELGGTSLQALSVFAKIEERLGCSLSPSAIIQAPTVARLAGFIRATTGTSLVPLRTSGKGLPLFLVTPGYHGVMQYRHLVRHLKSDRPVFGLQPLPLDGKHGIARSIESMAADYATEIRRVQPHGPYFITGHCYGGRVSFEIAQQLVREGERVSFLGLIDTVYHKAAIEGSPLLSEAVRVSGKARNVGGFQELVARGWVFIKWRICCRLLDLWFRLGGAIPHAHRFSYYGWVCTRARAHYAAKPYTGHITMFSSAGNSKTQRAHWGPLARGGLTVLEVPATHADIVSPSHSKVLAEYFDACLEAQGV